MLQQSFRSGSAAASIFAGGMRTTGTTGVADGSFAPLRIGGGIEMKSLRSTEGYLRERASWFKAEPPHFSVIASGNSVASSAITTAILRQKSIVFMPARAMCLACIDASRTVATKQILAMGNRLKMTWADTCSIFAEVIQLQMLRNWTDQFRIRKSVGSPSFVIGSQMAVPGRQFSSKPNPTWSAFINFRPKSFG